MFLNQLHYNVIISSLAGTTACPGETVTITCISSRTKGPGKWVQCEVPNCDQAGNPSITDFTMGNRDCKEKPQPIPPNRSQNAVPAWHYDAENCLLTAAGGCAYNATFCYGMYLN